MPLKPDWPRYVFEFPNECELAAPTLEPFDRELLLKKCCELELALRIVEGLASRPDGLKLSRDGVTGILPVIMLPWRNEAALMPAW